MVTLAPHSYYLDDWGRISDSYNKYISNHRQEVATLRQWLAKEPHLPQVPVASLALFHHLAKGSTEATKELMEAYFTLKGRNPDMFTHRCRDFKRVEQTLDLVEVAAVEPWDVSLDGGRLTFIRLVDTDVSKLDFHLAMQVFSAALDFEMARVGLYVKGIVAVLDMSGFHLGYLPKLNIVDVAVTLKFAQLFEKRVHCVHVINCNTLITQVMALVRPFLSKDLANKLHFHTPNQMDAFYKHVPREFTPSTYGGTLQDMTELNAQFRKRFQTAEEWLREIESKDWQTNENARRVKSGQEEMKGSFRKLCID